MEWYRFKDQPTAISAEQWICDNAESLGIGFSGDTRQWAIPVAERNPFGDPDGELTGLWIFPRISQNILDGLDDELKIEFMTTFQPEII